MKTPQPPDPNAEYDGSFRISALFFIFTAIFAAWFALMLAIAIGGKVVIDFLFNVGLFAGDVTSRLFECRDVIALSVLATIFIYSAAPRLMAGLKMQELSVAGRLRAACRRL